MQTHNCVGSSWLQLCPLSVEGKGICYCLSLPISLRGRHTLNMQILWPWVGTALLSPPYTSTPHSLSGCWLKAPLIVLPIVPVYLPHACVWAIDCIWVMVAWWKVGSVGDIACRLVTLPVLASICCTISPGSCRATSCPRIHIMILCKTNLTHTFPI